MSQANVNKESHEVGNNELFLTIEGQQYKWLEEYITGTQIKHLANIPPETEIYLSVKEPWEDELIPNEERVNLARPEIEHFYCKKKLPFTIEGKQYEWYKQYITGAEIRKIGGISANSEILLAVTRPWEDEIIKDDTCVDLARPGIEHFYVRKHGEGVLVTIHINDKPYEVKRGRYTVAEIKKKGSVAMTDELEELINGKLTPLADDATLLIKGCEQFFSHVRDGSSS